MHRHGWTRRLGATALLATLVAIAACGGRLGTARDAADGGASSVPVVSPTPTASATTAPSLQPSLAPSGAPPASTPVPTPDLSKLERLLDQLDDALASDATAPIDEGSPR